MLKQQTRERIQSLVHHPDFAGSVAIVDQKIFHLHNLGRPTFYVDVKIHGSGQNVLQIISEVLPDLKITKTEPFKTDHSDKYTFGDVVKGVIESSEVIIWATYREEQKEKDSAPTEPHMGNVLPNYTTESEVMANA